MFSFNNNFVIYILFFIFGLIQCLVELPAEENNDIAITEAAIRETANKLFATFRFRNIAHAQRITGHKPRLKKISVVHNFFVSIALKDCENLKKIALLSQVNNLDNNTLHFMTQINEVLNEGDKSNEATDDVYVNTLIERFIKKLRVFKNTYKFNRDFANFSINANFLKHFNSRPVRYTSSTNNVTEIEISEEEIWRPAEASGRRIFQGRRTRIKHFPFMASVQFFGKFQCAGSIIQSDLVITAASCLQLAYNNRFFRENPAFLSVQIGSNFYEASGENIPVIEIYFHPEYVPKTLNNNLALMRLSTHIIFSKHHKKVKRVTFDENPSPLPDNTDGIIIVGWGARDRSNIVYDPWINKLNFAELDYYPLTDCQEVYSKQYVTRKHFCAGFFSKASGACQHDVGGPGLSGGILVGVISFGPPTCGTPDAPTVFTKVGFYKDWINSIIAMPVPVYHQETTLLQRKPTLVPYFPVKTTKRFMLPPLVFTEKDTKINTYALRMRLANNSLRILEDDQLFKEFLSTMLKKRDIDSLGLSEDVTNLAEGKSTELAKAIVSTMTTTSTTTPFILSSDEITDNEEETDITRMEAVEQNTESIKTFTRSAERVRGLIPLTLPDDAVYEDLTKPIEDRTESIKAFTSVTEGVSDNHDTKLLTSTSVVLEPQSNDTVYIDANIENHIPKMKAIEEDKDISDETPYLLDNDNIFQELLSKLSNHDNKSYMLSNNMTTHPAVVKPIIIKQKNSKKRKRKIKYSTIIMTTTPSLEQTEYEDENESEVEDENTRNNLSKNVAIETTTPIKTYTSGDEGVGTVDDSKLEKDIADLLDELDVRKLLESQERSNNGHKKKNIEKERTENNVSIKKKINKKPTVQPVSNTSDETISKNSGESN